MDKKNTQTYDWQVLKRVFAYTKPFKNLFIWTVLLTIGLAALSPVRPFLTQVAVDKFIFTGNKNGLVLMIGIMLLLLIFQTVVQYYHTFLTNALGQNVIKNLRIDVFNHIIRLNLKYFDKTPIGQIITRTVSDLETIADIFSEGLLVIIGNILQLITIIAVMLYINWQLTLIILIPIPLLILATYIFKEAIKDAFQKVRSQVAALNTFLQEHISGVRIIQYFGRESQEFEKFKAINKSHRTAHIQSNWYYSIFFPVVEIIFALSLGLLVWYGSNQILLGKVTPGIVVSFIMYINLLFRPIRELADKLNTLQMGMVGADRIFKVMDINETEQNLGTFTKQIEGNVKFENVFFGYNDDHDVLKNITFTVKAGETMAIVGATGAGKSSIINLLNKFYTIRVGNIYVDDLSIYDYEQNFLRNQIGTVIQDVFLFSDSILNNITLKNLNITRAQVIKAAEEVGANNFIEKLPESYDYQVQERGATLSAGQAQLIAFIRAFVYNPKILVLDEATSSVDTETEMLIQKAIDKLMVGRTCIIIAHRLSTIQKANHILVLDKGEIVEQGNHQQLLSLNGFYKRLYDLQFTSSGIT